MMQATTGQMPEWSKGEDLRSSSIALRGFEPHSGHDHEQPVDDGLRLGGRRKTIWSGVRG